MKNFYSIILRLVLLGFFSLNTYAQTGAPDNFLEYYKQNCDFMTHEKYGDDWCNQGNTKGKSPNLVVIGDSFGNSFVTVLDAYNATNGSANQILYQQYGRGSCPTLLGHGPEWCASFAQKTYEHIKKTPEIKTVVMAGVWGVYISGKSYDDREWTIEASNQFKKSFVDTIKAYQKLGRRVVVIYQSPYGADPKNCIQRRISLGDKETKCKLPLQSAMNFESYRGFFAETLPKLKVDVFDPFPLFCDEKECQLKDGDKIFNTRGIHLSRYGGEFIVKKSKDKLDAILHPVINAKK